MLIVSGVHARRFSPHMWSRLPRSGPVNRLIPINDPPLLNRFPSTLSVRAMYRRIDYPSLLLSKNPDEAVRITRLMASRSKAPHDRLRAELLKNTPAQNEVTAQQWTDALQMIFSRDMRETSQKVLGAEYDFAEMGATAMYQHYPPSAYRLAVWLDVACDTIVHYAYAVVRYGHV